MVKKRPTTVKTVDRIKFTVYGKRQTSDSG